MATSALLRPAYVPILKWKMGEQSAVQALSDDARNAIMPIAEIQDIPYDWEAGEPSKSWEAHLAAVCKTTLKRWGTEHDLAIDQPILQADKTSSGEPAWSFLFQSLWGQSVRAVPCLSSLSADVEVEFLAELSAAANKTRWLLRYEYQPAADSQKQVDVVGVADWFRNLTKKLKSPHESIDAVVDIGFISAEASFDASFWASVAERIALQGPWRSLTLAAGAFPENLAGLKPGIHQLPRRDWALYKQIVENLGNKHRLLFGDYGVNYTDTFDADPRLMRMSANLRYTHLDQWFVLKARNVKDFGFGQYRELCELLVQLDPPYMGAAFSQGDASYFAVANDPSVGPGNATVWRKDATNHHIHVVLSQLASME